MYHVHVYALVNPFSPLVQRTEWDTVKESHSFGFDSEEPLRDHTIMFHLGAAELQEVHGVGLCLQVSTSLPIPGEITPAIIGYKVKLDGLKEQSALASIGGSRYRHGGAVGTVLNYISPSIEVEGPNRDEAVALAFAIMEGTAVRMTTTLQHVTAPLHSSTFGETAHEMSAGMDTLNGELAALCSRGEKLLKDTTEETGKHTPKSVDIASITRGFCK